MHGAKPSAAIAGGRRSPVALSPLATSSTGLCYRGGGLSRYEARRRPLFGEWARLSKGRQTIAKAEPGGTASAETATTNGSPAPAELPIATPLRLPDMGESAPDFSAVALNGNPTYGFSSAAGRPIVMLFLGSGDWAPCQAALALLSRNTGLFNDTNAAFFGVTIDPKDAAEGRIAPRVPGIRWFLDYDHQVSRLYSALRGDRARADYIPYWLLLDSTLRVVLRAPIDQGEQIFARLREMIAAGEEQNHAPVLMVPRVFEPALCGELIRYYETHGGNESGFMRTQEGKTVGVLDHSFKRRSDCLIEDMTLRTTLLDRMRRRLLPAIERAFHYKPTRIERWMVGCYDAERGGFFRPHRDNTTAGTAHRVFACTINLNAEEFEGGALRFPEYGSRSYRAPTGGAVIFSCSLLHEAMPVTRGTRYAFLPFFYDEEKARLREQNQIHFAEGAGTYRAGPSEAPAGSIHSDRQS